MGKESIVIKGISSEDVIGLKSLFRDRVIVLPSYGRLIDADALIIDIMDRGIDGLQLDDYHEIQQVIEDAPTIVQNEEKK